MKEQVQHWLKEKAFPLWLEAGVDRVNGGFFEELNLATGVAVDKPKRTMVQARQIYCLVTGLQLNLITPDQADLAIHRGAEFLLQSCKLTDGSFVHSVHIDGSIYDKNPDLYAQAFSLFGLAALYSWKADETYKTAAYQLADHLNKYRKLANGGFSELDATGISRQANPNMHLFEAAIAWAQLDQSSIWKELCDDLHDLLKNKLLQDNKYLLCEQFDDNWSPTRHEGKFAIEPGHHYEWAWLVAQYEEVFKLPPSQLPASLHAVAEKNGVHSGNNMAFDELWSDLSVKSDSHRFWPQCERIKSALTLGQGGIADEAMACLFKFFDTPVEGLWFDQLVDGQFRRQDAKASSFYHIVTAMAEYLNDK